MPADASDVIIEVIDGGFFTTVQDLGRFGYQRYGVPVSGAMDLFALRAANALTGTPEGAAALEITLHGPRLRFLIDTMLAMTGGDLRPRLDDAPMPMWQPAAVAAGAVLSFDGGGEGLRAYLAAQGGFDVPLVLGSRSTFTRTGLGGFEGRAIKTGDRLAAFTTSAALVQGRTLPAVDIPRYGHRHLVRVLPGPQDDAFTAAGMATLLSAEYLISPNSDRIGCRLEGPRIEHRAGADIISDGTPFGAIQVAGDGLPIILMADRGTTGGYAKIATVISADLYQIAQALPGELVGFQAISMEEALMALREQEATLERLAQSSVVRFLRRHYTVGVDGTDYGVTVGFTEQHDGSVPDQAVAASQVGAVCVEMIEPGCVGRVEVQIAETPGANP
ncbi:biotin-dependent carboxyltransferase family protein [soil metagenome]